ncbi:hypothetical protein [Pseudomonas sp. SCPG-7]|uniref:hypothetical protein n=1 Tax=Pseudomonas sp. SCPG-7 TaxID=1961714 RepID=UPI0015953527|nr:hypothetical protein [Pseudomonas sp. SCPG-7]
MAADGHLVALPDELRALIYFSHPLAAFGQKRTFESDTFWPIVAFYDRQLWV